jgi:hypothetical protein
MQQIFNLLVNMIIIESSSTNNFFEIFHSAENDNRIDFDTNALFENELNLVTANRKLLNKYVIYLLDQWDLNNWKDYFLWKIIQNNFERWIEAHFDQLNINIWIALKNFCYTHDYWINHNFDADRIKIITMLNVIQFDDWNDIWTLNQIKWVEKRYEILSRIIKKWKHELTDISNLDDVTIYFRESNLEFNRDNRNIILDDNHIRFTTSNDQHEMYSTLSMQFSYAYFSIRAQLEYNYHSDFSFFQFSSSVAAVSIRVFESVNQSIRIENQHVRFVFLSAFVSNQHARSASSSVIHASIFRNSTSIDENYYESTQFRLVQNFCKKLSQLNKIYKNDEKFKSTDDNFEFKLKIFFNKCKRVELSSHAYIEEIAFMLASQTLFHFYVNEYENITFDKFRVDMKTFFEEFEWKRLNLTKWQFIHIDNIIVANSNLSLIECFQKLCTDLNDIQKELNSDYHDSSHMRKILIRACKDHFVLLIELHNSSSNVSSLINSFYTSIINFESVNKKRNTYLQSINVDINECDHINCAHEHNFIDRQYRRESINYRDNRKFLIDFRFRDRFSIRSSKICFVCDKSNCWSINHSKKEREDSKKRFANRNSKWKSHSKFQLRLKQFIVEIEDSQKDDFIAQFFDELIIDIDISINNISITDFIIEEIDSESKTYFIAVDSIDDSKTIAAIIIMLVDKTFRHKLISMNSITSSANSISYSYNVFIVSRYDDREFKDILIDHDAADYSFEDIEQFTTLQRISKTSLILNEKRIISFRFDIDEISFIDTINLKTSVDVITFHIVFVHTSFLLCLVDMNRLRFYFNNLINMLIEERSINKVLSRKELYAIHSNQIKRFQIQILMSSKSLIRNDELILDFQIDMKASQTINDLQINLKIEHSRKIDYLHNDMKNRHHTNLHIDMKKEHHSMIRRYDHAFLFWNIFAQSLITESLD